MERVQKSIDIACPVATVYNQWTQFEEFPRFMTGVESVEQLDDTHVHWRAKIWGKREEWDAEITEQVPDQRIRWRSVSGDTPNAGEVRFESLPNACTRVHLAMEYEAQSPTEKAGDALGAVDRRVQSTVENFKKFIEKRAEETGAWRGEIRGGHETKSD